MIYLIDGNNLCFRAEKTNGDLTNKQGERVGAIYGVLTMLTSYLRDSKGSYTNYIKEQIKAENGQCEDVTRVFVCFDGGKSKFRTDLYPEYKAQRKKLDCMMTQQEKEDKERFFEQMELLNDYILPSMGIKTMKLKNYEADDLIYALSMFTDETKVIISTDKDMLQLVDKNTMVYSPFKEKLYTLDNFEKLVGIPKEFYLDYRIMVGDSSDNIKGIKGIGDKTARKLIKSYGGLNNMMIYKEELCKSKVTQRLFTEHDILVRNNDLMNLKRVPIDKLERYIKVNLSIDESFNANRFRKFLMENQMVTILKDFVSIREGFKDLH